MYKSPGFSSSRFLDIIQDLLKHFCKNVIYIGDVNIDLNGLGKQGLTQLFDSHGISSKLPAGMPTTNFGSAIDVCFSDIFDCHASLYESYYSYHKPILVTWKNRNLTEL